LLTIKSNKTGIVYNKTIDPVKLSISDLIISLVTPQPTEYNPVNAKITVINDVTSDDNILLYIIILDNKGNKVKEFSYNFFLDSDSSITKFISFTPTGAGSYTIKAQAKEKDLLLKETERNVIVQIAKPEVILSLSKTETTLPDDVMVQVQIRNGPVPRDYDVYLYVYAPDGSLIQQEKKLHFMSYHFVCKPNTFRI